jgi:hypothetical protein
MQIAAMKVEKINQLSKVNGPTPQAVIWQEYTCRNSGQHFSRSRLLMYHAGQVIYCDGCRGEHIAGSDVKVATFVAAATGIEERPTPKDKLELQRWEAEAEASNT